MSVIYFKDLEVEFYLSIKQNTNLFSQWPSCHFIDEYNELFEKWSTYMCIHLLVILISVFRIDFDLNSVSTGMVGIKYTLGCVLIDIHLCSLYIDLVWRSFCFTNTDQFCNTSSTVINFRYLAIIFVYHNKEIVHSVLFVALHGTMRHKIRS